MGTLTVRENLLFSANLRLNPKQHSTKNKHSRVDAIIQDLGLTDCANTKVQTQADLDGCISFIIKALKDNVPFNLKDCYFTYMSPGYKQRCLFKNLLKQVLKVVYLKVFF